jgi:phosphatidylinositol alpha-1,6-mannosyltransferase
VILFITRKYPPAVGGMERASYRLTTGLALRRDARIIAWGGTQKYLPLFAIGAFIRALALGRTGRVELIHLGDPVLGVVGYLLGRILRCPVVVTVHGLDVIYPNRLYQLMIARLLPTFDAVIAISQAARAESLRRGALPSRCFVVTYGVDPPALDLPERSEARDRLAQTCGLDFANQTVLLTTGRLVKRKGVAWFVGEVLPAIVRRYPNTTYLVVGAGPEEARIRAAIEEKGMIDLVRLLGEVTDATLWDAYRASDLFVMPNIVVNGDLEGFGLVALEAGIAERCVVAPDLEGIRDAIENGENGVLVRPADPLDLADTILRLLGAEQERTALGQRAQAVAAERFSWPAVVDRYLEVFDRVGQGSIDE